MKPKLLTALQPSDRTQAVLLELSREQGFQVESVSDSPTAVRWLMDEGPAVGVLAELNQQAPGFLELLAAVDDMASPIPVLGTANGGLVCDLPVYPSRALTLLGLELPAVDFATCVVSAISTSASSATVSCRQGIDYVLPAILCRRSVSLRLQSADGLAVSVELVGGDIWNAYTEDLEPESALEAILFAPVSAVEIRILQMIPGERQIILCGVDALSLATRASESAGQQPHGTNKVDMRAVVAELRAANSRSAKSEGAGESLDDRFEALLATGIEASLSRDYSRAGQAFEEALTIRPGDPRVRHNLERIRRHL